MTKNNYHILTFLRWLAANMLPEGLFEEQLAMGRVKQLFSSYVRIVEVENHSYCNRTCWFCPNSSIDRRSKNILMSQELFHKILGDLASIKYDQSFVFCGYCEALADDSIFKNVSLVRTALPKAYIKIYSNGDYLTGEAIRRLENTGLNQIRISLYPTTSDQQEHQALLKDLSKRTDLKVSAKTSRYKGWQLEGSPILIPVEIKNFSSGNMSSRAGYLSKEAGTGSFVRTAICFEPLKHISIAFNGKCMLCCQLRPDVAMHSAGIIGDLNEEGYSLFHYYRDLGKARGMLLKPGEKSGICRHCEANFTGAGPHRLGRHPLISGIFNHIPLINFFVDKASLFPRSSHQRYTQF